MIEDDLDNFICVDEKHEKIKSDMFRVPLSDFIQSLIKWQKQIEFNYPDAKYIVVSEDDTSLWVEIFKPKTKENIKEELEDELVCLKQVYDASFETQKNYLKRIEDIKQELEKNNG